MIDPDTIPLSRFTGPLRFRVRLDDTGHEGSAAWHRWLHAYITTLGADIRLQDEPPATPAACTSCILAPRERRILLAWLAEQPAVAAVDVVRGAPGGALIVEVCHQACPPSSESQR